MHNLMIDGQEMGLLSIDYDFLQGEELRGILIGGNLRCFLKLAGTEYMPDLTDKVLLMEALGGDIMSVRSMLAWLNMLEAFDKIKGIIIGTFTEIMKRGEYDDFLELIRSYIPDGLPVVVTKDIGHDRNAKGICIGREILLKRRSTL